MDLKEEDRMNVMPMMGLSIAMDNNCNIITEISRILSHADVHTMEFFLNISLGHVVVM